MLSSDKNADRGCFIGGVGVVCVRCPDKKNAELVFIGECVGEVLEGE